mmetsp:Transcript_31696/g.94494  ORF Transcript_31696/g.94494 Transcript_31696/m.94494 type:complete len:226 (-) Transcript_31696:690-1367(-)
MPTRHISGGPESRGLVAARLCSCRRCVAASDKSADGQNGCCAKPAERGRPSASAGCLRCAGCADAGREAMRSPTLASAVSLRAARANSSNRTLPEPFASICRKMASSSAALPRRPTAESAAESSRLESLPSPSASATPKERRSLSSNSPRAAEPFSARGVAGGDGAASGRGGTVLGFAVAATPFVAPRRAGAASRRGGECGGKRSQHHTVTRSTPRSALPSASGS